MRRRNLGVHEALPADISAKQTHLTYDRCRPPPPTNSSCAEVTTLSVFQNASPARASCRHTHKPALTWQSAFAVLLVARTLSAVLNIIHDCDEVYNYWEPLHYLLYGYGKQTWEYSAKYALRSYWYLLLHATIAAPAAAVFGAARGKVLVFLATRVGLGAVSAFTEAMLYRSLQRHASEAAARYTLALLCFAPGMFAAATALLPSSFAMYAMTAAAAAVIEGSPMFTIASAAIGIVWGWVVAGLAFVPYALYVLASEPLHRSLPAAVAAVIFTLSPLVVADRVFYGAWKASLWNFVVYNVASGGDSALYGVEPPGFYLRNGANQLAAVLPLAVLGFPLAAAWQWLGAQPGRPRPRVLVAAAPIYLWLGALSMLPHKEERFLYVVYPLMCMTAGVVLASLPDLAAAALHPIVPLTAARRAGRLLTTGLLLTTTALSLSRIAALRLHYGAPMRVYSALPEVHSTEQPVHVCVGGEWHRFPSSFFLPSPAYRLAFVQSSFGGLLPTDFDASKGGTTAGPAHLNDRNMASPTDVLSDTRRCSFVVALQDLEEPALLGSQQCVLLASEPFVDITRSPALTRALYIPYVSSQRNAVTQYQLYDCRRAARD